MKERTTLAEIQSPVRRVKRIARGHLAFAGATHGDCRRALSVSWKVVAGGAKERTGPVPSPTGCHTPRVPFYLHCKICVRVGFLVEFWRDFLDLVPSSPPPDNVARVPCKIHFEVRWTRTYFSHRRLIYHSLSFSHRAMVRIVTCRAPRPPVIAAGFDQVGNQRLLAGHIRDDC